MRVAGTWCDEWRGLQVDAVDRRHMVGMEFGTEVECARDKAGVGAVADSHGSSLATEHVVVGCGEQLDTRVVSLHVVWVIVKDVDNGAGGLRVHDIAPARRFGLCLNTLDDLFVCLAYRITDVEVQYDGIFRSLT